MKDVFSVLVAMVFTEDRIFKLILNLDKHESCFSGLKMVQQAGMFLD